MKKIFKYLLLAVMIFNTGVFAKSTNNTDLAGLEKTFEEYKKATLNNNIEKTLDYIYPTVFKVQPKEVLLASFKKAKESGKMPKINSIDGVIKKPIKTYSKGKYTLIDYTIDLTMDLTPNVKKENKQEYAKVQDMLNNPKKLASYQAFILQMFQASMGKDAKLKFQKDSLKLNIIKKSKMIAINENNSGWKFVELSPKTIDKLKSLLPQDIVKNEASLFNQQ